MLQSHNIEAGQNYDSEQLVRENISWMLALSEGILKDRALAEDSVQEAFLAAFKGMAKFEGRSSLKTWLHRITVNTALTKLRQIKRRAEQTIDDLSPEFDQAGCRIEPDWSYLTPLEDILRNEDLKNRVHDGINNLPDSYRIVLLLRDIEGYNTTEASELLGISEANTKVRLHRARSALKKLLEPILQGKDYI